MRPYYVITLGSGMVCLFMSLPLSIYLVRIEPLVPLLELGNGLIIASIVWRRLISDKTLPSGSRRYFVWALVVLTISCIANLLTAVIGTAWETGFSATYAASVYAGVALIITGSGLVILGRPQGRKL